MQATTSPGGTLKSLFVAVAVCGAALVVAACGGTSTPPAASSEPPTSAPSSPAASPTPAAQPQTAAAALTAAKSYFALYGAQQFAAVYPMIDPADRAQINESVWVAVHQQCGPTSGLSYAVTSPVLAGTTAVVTVSLAGAASSIASEQVSFVYVGGQWYYQPSDTSDYAGNTTAQAVAALKAAGDC
jgi:hypothetical protein